MDYNKILTQVFNGVNFKKDETSDFEGCMQAINKYLDEKLEDYQENIDENRQNEVIEPSSKIIVWDVNSSNELSNIAKVSKDRLSVTSSSAFSTLKANACIIKSKYMYEVQLKSKGKFKRFDLTKSQFNIIK